mmetsp:Transcript_37517/g.52075  ORF Transcript_37517/g.52075 Transcript_37517/m.52075 type:complete len:276 (+) Transcript_37517:192-1019(+)
MWSSVYGKYGAETGNDDAFQTLLASLTNLAGKGTPPSREEPKGEWGDYISKTHPTIKVVPEKRKSIHKHEWSKKSTKVLQPNFGNLSFKSESYLRKENERYNRSTSSIPVQEFMDHIKPIAEQNITSKKYHDPANDHMILRKNPGVAYDDSWRLQKKKESRKLLQVSSQKSRLNYPTRDAPRPYSSFKQETKQVLTEMDIRAQVSGGHSSLSRIECDLNVPPVREIHEEHMLCKQYCPLGLICNDTDVIRAARCLRAGTGQPDWLPWPVGGALHT